MLKALDVIYVEIEAEKWVEAKEFYQEKLALKTHLGGDEMGWIEYKVNSSHTTSIAISRLEEGLRIQSGTGGIPVFLVEDIEDAIAVLKENNVQFQGDLVEGFVRLIKFVDPCGNVLQLVECH